MVTASMPEATDRGDHVEFWMGTKGLWVEVLQRDPRQSPGWRVRLVLKAEQFLFRYERVYTIVHTN